MKIRCGKDLKQEKDLQFLYKKNDVQRAGIIPYLIDDNGDTYILLGVDKGSGLLADLGGTREKGEKTIEVAIREFLEESRGVLEVDLNKTTTIVVCNLYPKKKKQVILFPRVENNLDNVNIDNKFQKTVPRNKYEDEMSDLIWIHLEDFMKMPDRFLSLSLQKVKEMMR